MEKIKNIFLLFVLAHCVSCVGFMDHSESNIFYLTFGSCYDNDILTVGINDSTVLEKITLDTDFSTGIVLNVGISYLNDRLAITTDENTVYKALKIERYLKISLSNIEQDSTYLLDLKKGRYLIADACNPEGIKISQFKKPILVE
jgi:hypothetical protein